MDIDAKLRPLYLLQILKAWTDEDHYLTTKQLCDLLKQEHGIETHRTTIKGDIECLRKAGFGVDERRSTQNQYRYLGREFEVGELKTVIDAIASSKFIGGEQSSALIEKVTALAGGYKARALKRNVVVNGRNNAENGQLLSVIDTINDAINQHRKISFQEVEYNIKKERVLRSCGERYVFSPYSLVWDGENYHMVGFSEKDRRIACRRVDRMAEPPVILEEPAAPSPAGFSTEKYVKAAFGAYDAPRVEVELLCDNSTMDAVIDCFGPDVQTYAGDMQNFRVIEEIAAGKEFLNWIFGFEGKIRIIGPESVREQYRQMLENVAKSLEM